MLAQRAKQYLRRHKSIWLENVGVMTVLYLMASCLSFVVGPMQVEGDSSITVTIGWRGVGFNVMSLLVYLS